MKPLPAPLTQMDDWIYVWRVWRSRPELDRNHLEASSILADSRDAELMFRAEWPCPTNRNCQRKRSMFQYGRDPLDLWRRCAGCGNIWRITPP